MVFEYKVNGLYSVDAQTAGEELERIYNENGELEPSKVVDESRPENAPLHSCFEWDDGIAAEKFREQQARNVIGNIVIVDEVEEKETYVRAYPHIGDTYRPMYIVLENRDMTQELLQTALRELRSFEMKYRELSELAPVFDAIQKVTE